jgi:hypothetical protein
MNNREDDRSASLAQVNRLGRFGAREALRAVLLFHDGEPWDFEKAQEWRLLTGDDRATTRVLCDLVRKALAAMPTEERDEHERSI